MSCGRHSTANRLRIGTCYSGVNRFDNYTSQVVVYSQLKAVNATSFRCLVGAAAELVIHSMPSIASLMPRYAAVVSFVSYSQLSARERRQNNDLNF